MRRATQFFLYVLLSASLVAPALAQEEKPPRVRAKEPTVVTVEGTPKKVELDHERSKDKTNPFVKAVKGIGRGIVNGVGALLNVEDDIPSERERARQEQSKQ